jgi:hypothetical protein
MTQPSQSNSVGYQPGERDQGMWTIQIPGGLAFAANAIAALTMIAAERQPDSPTRDVLERIHSALLEAIGVMSETTRAFPGGDL